MTRPVARRRAGATALPEWIQAAAHPARRRGAGRARVAARNQIRRLPHACAPRPRYGAAAHAHRLDWTHKYPAIADAVASSGATQAYLDGEFCGVRPDGVTSFSMIQLASDSGNAAPSSS